MMENPKVLGLKHLYLYLSGFNVLAIFWDISCHSKVCYLRNKFLPYKNIPGS